MISNVYVIVTVSVPVTVTLLMLSAANATGEPGIEHDANVGAPALPAQISIPLISPPASKSVPAVNVSASVVAICPELLNAPLADAWQLEPVPVRPMARLFAVVSL